MDERKQFILKAVIHSYILEGKPVGSRTLQRDYQMDISPATIRNEMSDLEYDGYLLKSHSSSGRLPSDKGYRWYVDQVMDAGFEPDITPALSDRSSILQSNAFGSVLARSLDVLSDMTDLVSLALVPGRGKDVLNRIELISVSPHEAVLVSIFHSKMIKADFIHLSQNYSSSRLKRNAQVLEELLEGKTLEEMNKVLDRSSFSGDYIYGNLISELLPSIRRQVQDSLKSRLVFRGLSKLYRMPDLVLNQDTSNLINWLQESPEALELFPGEDEEVSSLQVKIGKELPNDFLTGAALVYIPYGIRGDNRGYIGLLGPSRMNYPKAMQSVVLVGRYMNSITTRV